MPFNHEPAQRLNVTLTDIDETQTPAVAVFSDDTKLFFAPADKKNQPMFDDLKFAPANHNNDSGDILQVRMLVQPAKGPQFFIPKHATKEYVMTCIKRIEKGC